MKLKKIEHDLTVCKVQNVSDIDMTSEFYFIGKTDEEISLVCKTEDTPSRTVERDDGWKGFRIQGTLDFSLIGILSKLSGILADHKIGIFAVSTYNTDYILVKEENFARALKILAGHLGLVPSRSLRRTDRIAISTLKNRNGADVRAATGPAQDPFLYSAEAGQLQGEP